MTVKEFMKGKVVFDKLTRMFNLNKPNEVDSVILQLRDWSFFQNQKKPQNFKTK